MARLVFGPKTSAINYFGVHLAVTVRIYEDAGETPACLALVATSPLGNAATVAVSDGARTTLGILKVGAFAVSATVATEECNPQAPGSPDTCTFKVVVRARGKIPVGPIQIPISAQIDAYHVLLRRGIDALPNFADSTVGNA